MLVGLVPKQPGEKFQVTFDFAADLAVDSTTISEAVVTAKDRQTGVAYSALLDGSRTIVSTQVRQKIKDGVDGGLYRIQAVMSDSAGNIFEAEVDINVKEY